MKEIILKSGIIYWADAEGGHFWQSEDGDFEYIDSIPDMGYMPSDGEIAICDVCKDYVACSEMIAVVFGENAHVCRDCFDEKYDENYILMGDKDEHGMWQGFENAWPLAEYEERIGSQDED